jgi:hypothetical protein
MDKGVEHHGLEFYLAKVNQEIPQIKALIKELGKVTGMRL